MRKVEDILKKVIREIDPKKEDLELIKNSTEKFSEAMKANLKKLGINAEVFVGGSFSKRTVIKKDKYDVDVFIRYDKKYKNEEISLLTKKALKRMNFSSIHGSRDYFRINVKNNFFIEIIPVKKINKPEEYENVTDLSYFHVKYINKKIKSKKIIDGIKIAKAFCYANGCYGAESYISGFSGYSLELLVYYYKGFLNFIKAISKMGKEKEIIDIERRFRNKRNALIDLNSSKLNSPIILIDPTYKQRNALAALSQKTYERFQKACKDFLKNPSLKSFEIKKINLNKIKENATKKKREFILLEAETNKPEGDVAGSKLLKFYNHIEKEISRFFRISKKGFNYNNKKSARYFFVAKNRGEIICGGPYLIDKKNILKFKRLHKKTFQKNSRIYSRDKINFTLMNFIDKWKIKNKKKIQDMNIVLLKEVK
ncbi:MAG: hypothetical protein ABIE36_02540 [Candidatus Diapherotrites archaeon]